MDSCCPNGRTHSRRRILLVAEAVTLAHVARTITLAKALDPAAYEVHVACAPRFLKLFPSFPFELHDIATMPTASFLGALTRVRPIWDQKTLSAYVQDELALIDRIDPELVVGDLRISLAVSTRVARRPLMTVVNAYWSPYADSRFSIPDVHLVRWLGAGLCDAGYRWTRPLAFALHAAPLNRVCKRYGVAPVSHDLRRVFTFGDYTLYPDVPELVPTRGLPSTHRYLGPVLWSPEALMPAWWGDVPDDRPQVYVTLGSSGQASLLKTVLQALQQLPVTAIAATAGRVELQEQADRVFLADYLPGDVAAARASLVICNGGSPTTYQALAEGTPVLGLASNTDQFLNMDAVQRFGAGRGVRAMTSSVATIRRFADEMIQQHSYRDAAERLRRVFSSHDAAQRFREVVREVLP